MHSVSEKPKASSTFVTFIHCTFCSRAN